MTFFKALVPASIQSIFTTLVKSKIEKSIEDNLEQPLNKANILSTLDVSIFPKFTDSKFVQPSNSFSNVLTPEISNLDKSAEIKLEQPLNIPPIEVKWRILVPKFTLVKLVQPSSI